MEPDQPIEDRITQVLQQLGIPQAHVLANMPQDWRGLVVGYPDRVASLTLVCPTSLDPNHLSPVAARLLVFTGDQGPQPQRLRRALAAVPGVPLVELRDYASDPWADVVSDKTGEMIGALLEFLQRMDQHTGLKPVAIAEREGEVSGISYRVRGSGRPLVLFPLGLAPSQWDALLPTLEARYCTITLGGSLLGTVAHFEARGRLRYLGAVREVMDVVQVRPEEVVVEVGCGTGVLLRWLARQTKGANRILGLDINRYLLREAAALAARDGLADVLTLQEGNAEALPLPDKSVDVAFACTVLEEGDADQMLAEMVRVIRPGGRVAVIVRAIDVPWWVNLPLPAALKRKVEQPGWIGANVSPKGCADASLYQRFHRAGLTQLSLFPYLVAATQADPRFPSFQQQYVGTLTTAEADEWRRAVTDAEAAGTFFISQPFHCAIGTKR